MTKRKQKAQEKQIREQLVLKHAEVHNGQD